MLGDQLFWGSKALHYLSSILGTLDIANVSQSGLPRL